MYENRHCEYCGEAFAKNDDVVVCPDCGAPYHRSCWQAHGVCAHAAEHAGGYAYQAAPSAPEPETTEAEDFVGQFKQMIAENRAEARQAQPAAQQTQPGICEECGAKMIDGFEYCPLCAHKKGDFIRRGNQKNAGRDPLAGMSPADEIGGVKAGSLALLVRGNADKFLPRFQRIADKKVKIGWSWQAFLFGYFYLFFRKMYKFGIIVVAAMLLLVNVLNFAAGSPIEKYMQSMGKVYTAYAALPENISAEEYAAFLNEAQQEMLAGGNLIKSYAVVVGAVALTNIFCALFFDALYFRHCRQTVARMDKSAEILGDMSEKEYRVNLLARGGVSVLGVVLAYMINLTLSRIIEYILSMFG